MRYYSEETVKKIMEKVDVSYHSYSQYDTSLQEEVRKYPNLNKFKSIDVKEPHGRLVDIDIIKSWMTKKHKENNCPFDIDAFLYALDKIPTVLKSNKED